MIIPQVQLEEPEDLAAVITLLSKNKGHAMLIAGGTDLLVDIKNKNIKPRLIISLVKVKGLRNIEEDGKGLKIGALVTPNVLANSEKVRKWLPALSEAAQSMASYQIRNMATIGGNICSAVPSADLPPALIAAGAWVRVSTDQGDGKTKLMEFFQGPRKSCLGEDEVVTHIVIPVQPAKTGISYQKFKLRGSNALAVAASAVRLTLEDGRIKDAMVVLGAVAPVPLVATETMELLIDNEPTPELFKKAALQASKEAKPISDIRGSKSYRKRLVRVLTRRALDEALKRAKEVEA